MRIKLDINPRIFNKIFLDYGLYNQNRIQIYFGGSSSGKSYFLAQRTILDVLQGRNYLVVRKVGKGIKRSIFSEIVKAIYNFKVQDYFAINHSDLAITCILNNKQILFSGLDDPEKIKSITAIDGAITDILVEEATEILETDYRQLTKRLRGVSKFKKRVTFAFNPILKTHWLYKEFFDIWEDDKQYVEKDGISILKTTYKDNKHLTEDDIVMLLAETDQYYRDVYINGNWGVLGDVIFKNYEIKEFDYTEFDNIRNGIDWGFSNDPFAYVRLHYDYKKKEIYIFDEIYSTELDDEQAMELVDKKLENRRELIFADSAEPKTINLWKRNYFNIKAVKKGAGSIETGIKFLQRHKIYIHSKCKGAINEFQNYMWKKNKNGESLPIPLDKDNHIIDAIRYALSIEINASKNILTNKPKGF